MTSLLVKKAVTVAYAGLQESLSIVSEIEDIVDDAVSDDTEEKLKELLKKLELEMKQASEWLVAVKEDK